MTTDWKKNGAKRKFRDYHKRSYGNPLFPNKKKRGGRTATRNPGSWKWKVLTFVLAVLTGTLAWYLFWSPTFTVTTVEITGLSPTTESKIRDIVEEQMQQKKFLIFPQTSLFLFNKSQAETAIQDFFFLESLTIKKKLPGSILFTASEIPMRAVLYTNGRFMAMGETGSIIRELTEREIRQISDLPDDISSILAQGLGAEMIELSALEPQKPKATVVNNKNSFPLLFNNEESLGERFKESATKPGDTIFSSTSIALVLRANARLPDITGDAVRWYTIKERDEAIDITMDNNWHLFLTTALPFEVQGARLNLVLKEKVSERKEKLQYIDLRYNERIYFKFDEEETSEE